MCLYITLQVYIPSIQTRITHSISSDDLAKSTASVKSFSNIQQSCKRPHMNSCTDNMGEIPGTSSEITENSLTFRSKSNELIDINSIKTKEVAEAMQGLHFSMIDLRNKLSKGHIIPQPYYHSGRNWKQCYNASKGGDIPPAQSCCHEIRCYLHKEMNLCIKASYYDALSKTNIYPPWTTAFQPPPNLMLNQCQIETLFNIKKIPGKGDVN